MNFQMPPLLAVAFVCRLQLFGCDLAREKEVDILYEKLFEEKILGNLTEDHFKKLSYKRMSSGSWSRKSNI